jgi:hypothetical protein
MNQFVPFRSADTSPALIAAAGESAQLRFVEFFTTNIRNRKPARQTGPGGDAASIGPPADRQATKAPRRTQEVKKTKSKI